MYPRLGAGALLPYPLCFPQRQCITETAPAGETMQAHVPVAVCSTSNERAVSTIVRVLLGPEVESKMRVFAGDIVAKKKPSPDIYNLAASELKVDPSRYGMPCRQAVPAKSPAAVVIKNAHDAVEQGIGQLRTHTAAQRRISGCVPC